ncbi:MAG: hypothetical protein M3454_14370 [Actinomycetota bacterium]|nr:hypothetical protein [Actinomycetota bacterium]
MLLNSLWDWVKGSDAGGLEEFDALTELGLVWSSDRDDWAMRGSAKCPYCSEEMELRGFEQGDRAYRAYALCVICGWWMEF